MTAPPGHSEGFGNVEQADFLLRLTGGEPWALPLRWETEAGDPIDISGPGWKVRGVLRLPSGDRRVGTTKTAPADGGFTVRLEIEDVAALSTARPDRLVVTIEDPSPHRFHFVFPAIRREL